MKINWKKIFNWDIQSVSHMDCHIEPQFYDQNGDRRGGMVRQISFTVNYMYHGPRKFVFRGDDERLYTAYGNPVLAANALHQDYVDTMRRQQQRCQVRNR